MKRILITGGAGFIGHHIVEHLLKNTDAHIVVMDKLSYASPGWKRLHDIEVFDPARVSILAANFAKPIENGLAIELGDITHILHLGAESHVNNCIKDGAMAIETNVLGTHYMLEYAQTLKNLELFLYFSTDEVFGPAPAGVKYKEGDRRNPGNNYAATKSAAEDLCSAAANTHKLPIVITNTMNVFGERQHPEKLIPKAIKMILAGEEMEIHGDTSGNSGSRFWIHARNVADAVLWIINNITDRKDMLRIDDAAAGKYNIVGEREISTLDLCQMIAKYLGRELKYHVSDAGKSRPGHDFRYALDGSKMAALGWQHPRPLEESLDKALQWMMDPSHNEWINL